MGKKAKVGKARKDKFYQLAKETGYRARSAFKLLQLNRKYEFLQNSRVCVDLCAAPGGWLQVASQQMPVSSLIVGIDLVPIRAIPHCITLQEDITTPKCRQTLKKELKDWQADVFLNDGAPNVGKSWLHDAFMQAELTLAALKLASEFLRKGGWFISKVFRSKDYHALMWVFNQLFKRVYATKPQASRNESAEIFVVCQGYVKPDKLDPKFLDPKYVFKDVEKEAKKSLNVLYPTKDKKAKAEGYADGDMTLHHRLNVTEFISANNFLELLGDAHQIVLDHKEVLKHPLTTIEIKACCEDIKVLGKKEIRALVTWRKKMKEHLESSNPEQEESSKPEQQDDEEESKDEDEEVNSDEDEEEAQIQKQIVDLKEEEVKEAKKKRRKVMKEKRKLRDKMNLNMVHKGGDNMDIGDDMELFNLKKIKSKKQLKNVEDEEMEDIPEDNEDSDDGLLRKKNVVKYNKYEDEDEDDSESEDSEDEEEDILSDSEDEEHGDEEEDGEENPLVVNLEGKDVKAEQKMNSWFNKDVFGDIEEEKDEDLEIEQMTEEYHSKGGVILGPQNHATNGKMKGAGKGDVGSDAAESGYKSDSSEDSDSGDDSNSDYDINESVQTSTGAHAEEPKLNKVRKDGFEIVPQGQQVAKRVRKLDPEGLALGEELIKSVKRRRELIEMSFNRYTFNDDHLPDWFVKDEQKHSRIQLPVSQEQVAAYKEKLKAINAAPIKKVAEAKARKKRKMTRRLEKARKKAESVSETYDVSDKEKMQQIKQIYKRAGLLKNKKEDLTYVVAKRGVGRKVSRPAGVKGRFKVVDPRMKKDMRSVKKKMDIAKGKSKGKGKGKGGKR